MERRRVCHLEFVNEILVFRLEDKIKNKKRKLENGNEIPKKKAKIQKVNSDEEQDNTKEDEIETTGKENRGKYMVFILTL
jgi:hypothetical protein